MWCQWDVCVAHGRLGVPQATVCIASSLVIMIVALRDNLPIVLGEFRVGASWNGSRPLELQEGYELFGRNL